MLKSSYFLFTQFELPFRDCSTNCVKVNLGILKSIDCQHLVSIWTWAWHLYLNFLSLSALVLKNLHFEQTYQVTKYCKLYYKFTSCHLSNLYTFYKLNVFVSFFLHDKECTFARYLYQGIKQQSTNLIELLFSYPHLCITLSYQKQPGFNTTLNKDTSLIISFYFVCSIHKITSIQKSDLWLLWSNKTNLVTTKQ